MITVKITGFKTIEEAQAWVTAYQGGVEQDMSIWAEESKIKHPSGYGFPFNVENYKRKNDTINVSLVHPDKYLKDEN